MGLIPTESLDLIRARLDIAELVQEYVPDLKRAGRNMKGRCPFHQERTPSFIVSPERQSFHCFGCGEGGDVFAFLMKIENLGFSEAAEKLAERTGVKIEDKRASDPGQRERLKLKELLEFAQDFYHDLLKGPSGGVAREYLAKRGVAPESVDGFKLGFAKSGANLLGAAARKGFPSELLVKAGLASARDGRSRDYFYDRVLYPIRDARGGVAGFGARTLGDGLPKYLNSPDSGVFSKGKVLYGLFQGLAEIRKARRAILMEGYMDVIAAHQHGIRLACAPLGTALTQEQAVLLKRYVSDVTLVFDADGAGLAAALRGAQVLLAQGLGVRIATIPEGKDPDEHLRQCGVQSFSACLEKAVDLAEYQTELELRKRGAALGPEDKAAVARTVLATIEQCPDEVLKGEWIHRLAQRLKTGEEALLRQLNKTGAGQAKVFQRRGKPESAPRAAAEISGFDEQVLLLLMKKRELADTVRERDFESAAAARILKALSAVAGVSEPSWSAQLLAALPPTDKAVVSRLLVDGRRVEEPESALRELLGRRRSQVRLKELEPSVLAMGGANPVDAHRLEEYRKLVVELKGTRKDLNL